MNKNHLLRDLVLVFSLILLSGSIFAQERESFSVRNFTKQEYNAESQNWSITEDANGFIYVANNIGLLEFDGIDWDFHPSPNGTVIRSVAVDDENRIFTSGYREIGYWERDKYGNLKYISLNDMAEPLFSQNEEFWNTVITKDKVYFHSFSSIFVYDYATFKVIRPGAMIGSVNNVDEEIYVHLSQLGLFTLEDTILTPFLTEVAVSTNLVYFVKQLSDSSLLIGTESDGLYVYKDDVLSPYLEEWKDFFVVNNINRGAISGNGHIIIGTLIDGVMIFDQTGNPIHHINNSNGLQNNTILGINIDRDNNIWLSLDKGIDFISYHVDPSFSYYEYNEIGAVYAASLFEGNLYLSTNQGVFYRDWDVMEQRFRMVPGTQGQAWSCDVHKDELIVGHNRGTFKIKGGQVERISSVGGGFGLVRHLENADMLIQSTYSNIVFYEYGNTGYQFKYQLPGYNDLIRYLEPDHLDNLWASHMHRGVIKLHLSDDHRSILNASYFGDSIFGQNYNIQVFKVENRIVFTTGKNMYTYNDLNDSIILHDNLNDHLEKYRMSHRVVSGPDHHYWFISSEGIALFRIFEKTCELIKEYPIELFRDHLIIGYENIYPLNDYQAVLCLDNGFAILRADQTDLSIMIENKNLSLKGVEVRGEVVIDDFLPVDMSLTSVPFKMRNLTFSYSFPLFSNEKIEYQRFIIGLDKSWSSPLEKPVFTIDRIPPGKYSILVRAFNKWNNTSITNEISLEVEAPWYLKKISFLAYSLFIIALLILARQYLLRRIRNRERRIRDGKEKELIRLRNEKLNAELSYRSQELANSTMSIIKKNEFLLNLKETIRRQKDDLGTRYPDKFYNQLNKKIDNNISSMDDWKVFEFHFEKAHEKFLQKLKHKYPELNHGDLRLCAYLRMNLTSKEIAPLLRISVRGVENHRYKLRKKLNLKSDENLTDFIMSI
jgi:DNA-binding CsgD family transcriptional regulator